MKRNANYRPFGTQDRREYRTYNLTGDGIVDSSCDTTNYDIPSHPTEGNLSLYDGDTPLPETLGHLYRVNNQYHLMAEMGMTREDINTDGLKPVNCGIRRIANPYADKGNPMAKGYYYPNDGRVIDTVRNIPLVLDRPAYSGSVHMDDTAYIDNRNYGANYRDYRDIQNGQITYYIDKSVEQPFYGPVYTLSSTVDKVIRKDPMDSVRTEYIKKPVTSSLHHVSNDQFTRDTLSHREDLMSLQQSLYNRTKWTSHWNKE
jgi:hypothetical protein